MKTLNLAVMATKAWLLALTSFTKRYTKALMTLVVGILILPSCSSVTKLRRIQSNEVNSTLYLPSETEVKRYGSQKSYDGPDEDGLYVMSAVVDEQTGLMQGFEELDAAIIQARFRNTAERQGQVRFDFMIVAPDSLQDASWQLRFFPVIRYESGEETELAPVYLTGQDFRRAQQKAQDRYDAYLKSISQDSTRFVDRVQVEAFMERFPEAHLTAQQLESHFRRDALVKYNSFKVSQTQKVRNALITTPLYDKSVRRDSTLTDLSQKRFIYVYRQTIRARPSMKKFFLSLKTQIWDGRKVVYSNQAAEAITYYVSSLSGLINKELARKYESDSTYQKGILKLEERSWEEALELLAPYEDYHSALAYLSLEYNATACELMQSKSMQDAPSQYLLALSYSRRGDEKSAVEHLCKAVELEPSYKYRGNLDPEIASIIMKYNLFLDED